MPGCGGENRPGRNPALPDGAPRPVSWEDKWPENYPAISGDSRPGATRTGWRLVQRL